MLEPFRDRYQLKSLVGRATLPYRPEKLKRGKLQ
jgi:hypothetical protein